MKDINKEILELDQCIENQEEERQPMPVRRGEIYMADLNPAKGSEQGGIRPVIILNNDKDYGMSSVAIVLPITTSWSKRNLTKTHIRVRSVKGVPKDSVIVCEQIRTIDKQRLYERVGKIDDRSLIKAEKALIRALDLTAYLKGTHRNK